MGTLTSIGWKQAHETTEVPLAAPGPYTSAVRAVIGSEWNAIEFSWDASLYPSHPTIAQIISVEEAKKSDGQVTAALQIRTRQGTLGNSKMMLYGINLYGSNYGFVRSGSVSRLRNVLNPWCTLSVAGATAAFATAEFAAAFAAAFAGPITAAFASVITTSLVVVLGSFRPLLLPRSPREPRSSTPLERSFVHLHQYHRVCNGSQAQEGVQEGESPA